MDDKRIIEMFFARDEACLAAVTNKYGKLCMHIAENFLSCREDAEECLKHFALRKKCYKPSKRTCNIIRVNSYKFTAKCAGEGIK